jgi:glycosyltransferase involved in cell wall biosynthesis
MTRVASDPSAADDLRRRGIARAAAFTWTRCAEQTLAVYEKALGAAVTQAPRVRLGNWGIG